MAYEFKRLSDVNIIEAISDNSNVLVENNGEIVKIAANEISSKGTVKTINGVAPDENGDISIITEDVLAQENAAAKSATEAAESATAASNSASSAATSATEASQSAENAAQSAQEAQTAAQNVAQIDDTGVFQNKVWSSQNIINELCPTFKVSGRTVHCRPMMGSPLEVISHIDVTQEGNSDPSVDNIRPFNGYNSITLYHKSKNLFDTERIGNIVNWDLSATYGYIDLQLPSGTYTMSAHPETLVTSGGHICVLSKIKAQNAGSIANLVDAGGSIFSVPITFTIEDGESVYINWYCSSVKNQDTLTDLMEHMFTNCQIELGSEATEYEEFQNNTYTATFDTMIYGGKHNWATGVFTNEWANVELNGSEDWQMYTSAATPTHYYFYIKVGDKGEIYDGEVLSSHYKKVLISSGTADNGVYIVNSSAGEARLLFRPDMSVYTTLDDWKTHLQDQYESGTPVTAVYKLTRPQDVQLDGYTIMPVNCENILSVSIGNIDVIGRVDIPSAVNKQTEEIEKIKARFDEDFRLYGLPVLYLNGDVSAMTKDNAVELKYRYVTKNRTVDNVSNYIYITSEGTCTCKWQGSSSVRRGYPKRNYTIKFDSPFEAKAGWGEQKKYCMKANWIDPSALRNVVSAKLWGQIVNSRKASGELTTEDKRTQAPNYGAIDGFPIIIVINGEFTGLYTWNIPKDGWMFAMGDGTAEYVLCSESNSEASSLFKGTAVCDETDYSIEYKPDGVEDATVVASFNTLLQAAIDAGEDWETTLAPYLDINSVYDYFIFINCINGHDNLGKNILYGTYDGVKWFMSVYDLDTTYGSNAYGEPWHINPADTPWAFESTDVAWYKVVNDRNQFEEAAAMHRLAYLIYTYGKEKLKTRYQALRSTILSDENVWYMFANFANKIPRRVYNMDAEKWQLMPATSMASISTYMDYYRMHCAYLDKEIAGLETSV